MRLVQDRVQGRTARAEKCTGRIAASAGHGAASRGFRSVSANLVQQRLLRSLWRGKRSRHVLHRHIQGQPSMQQGLLVLKRCWARVSQWAASEGCSRKQEVGGAGAPRLRSGSVQQYEAAEQPVP